MKDKSFRFEALKKSHKKKLIIGGLIISIVGIVIFSLTRAKYQNIEDIKLVEGTINYKSYDFKMIAMYKSEDGTNYTEITDRMPDSGYVINEEKSYCTTDGVNKDTAAKLYTEGGKHIIQSLAKNDKCYLYFDKYTPQITISEIIAGLSYKTTTPTFSSVATTDEGVYRVSDGMYGGYSYYWRGAVTNNYVTFAGFCWRIIRINGDSSMRLIYDGATCHANGTSTTDSIAVTKIAYNSNYDKSEYVGWTYTSGVQRPTSITTGTDAPIKTALESWYTTNITNKGYDSQVATGKFCNDRNVAPGYTWSSAPSSTFYYASYTRLHIDYAPTLSCATLDTYSLKVGLITADEVVYAGGVHGSTDNNSYYLYNGQEYWTMSSDRFIYTRSNPDVVAYSSLSGSNACVVAVYPYGNLASNYVNGMLGIRPVINLTSSTTFATGGTGTQTNPYVVL